MDQPDCERAGPRTVVAFVLATLFASCHADGGAVPVLSSPVAPVPPSPPPPGIMRSFAGTVHEVNGGPLAGVQVSALPRFGGPSTTTDDQGKFELETITDEGGLFLQKPGYRWNDWRLPSLSNPSALLAVRAKLQPIFTLSADAGVVSVIAPDDLTYSSDIGNSFWDGTYYCSPCKEIRVFPNAGSGQTLHLRWAGSVTLDLWGGRYYNGLSTTVVGQQGQSELTLSVPTSTIVDTLLVGLGLRHGAPQVLQETINFQLTIEPVGLRSTK